MSDFDILFPVPENRRNADDMGMPSPVKETRPELIDELRALAAYLRGEDKPYSADAVDRAVAALSKTPT